MYAPLHMGHGTWKNYKHWPWDFGKLGKFQAVQQRGVRGFANSGFRGYPDKKNMKHVNIKGM